MEENKRFRNHFSIVFERLGTVFVAIVMFGLYEGVEFLGEVESMISDFENFGGEIFSILIICLGVFIAFAAIVGFQILRWARTYISIQDQAIVIEVNTLNRKKNTIGIQNISNINLEQNLFEMLMGTYKVKLDTNSMSTADETDVKIVLKKDKAEKFRAQLLSMIEVNDHPRETKPEEMTDTKGAGIEEMLVQGILSLKLITIPLLVLSIIGIRAAIVEVLREDDLAANILSVISSMFVASVFAVSLVRDIIKGFIQYYGFRIQRLNDRLYIRYGLLKKVSYTIPIDKINAIKLVQSPQARLTGRYMAELINVGMGDEKDSEQSFFLLYDKKQRMIEKVREYLPEFADELDSEIHTQSAKVWIVWLLPTMVYVVFVIAAVMILNLFPGRVKLIVIGVIAAISLILMLYVVGNYFTRGYSIGEKSLKLVDGGFGKSVLLVKYSKIQFVRTRQNVIAKHFGIQKGEIYLLASTANRVHNIPYFPEKEVEVIRERLV